MKTIVITGASSGIGAKIVELASQSSWQVLMVARRKEVLDDLVSKYENCLSFPCDLSDSSQIEELVNKLNQYPIQALVNNAGAYRPQSIDEDEDQVWDFHYQVNLMSAVRLTRGLWNQLKKHKASIVNISSTLALRPIASTAAYSAIKAAMNNWSQSLAIEGAPYGVRSNCICPGIIETPIHGFYKSDKVEDKELYQNLQSAQPLGRTGKVTDIAPMALQLADPANQWTTGATINIDGGILLNS